MRNLKQYYVPSCLICYFIYFNITILGLVDASPTSFNGSKPIDATKPSKHGIQEATNEAKSKGQTQLPNSEGELQVLDSTKLTGAGSKKRNIGKHKTAPHKSAIRSQKIESQNLAKMPKGKKSKSSKTTDRSSVEDANWLDKLEDDDDILQKATEHTKVTADDYDWGSDEDWDTVYEQGLNGSRVLNVDSDDRSIYDDSGSHKPKHKQAKRKLTTPIGHQTTASKKKEAKNIKPITSKNSTKTQQHSHLENKTEEKALMKKTPSKPSEPRLRGFEDSASAITAEVVSSSEFAVQDYSITYKNSGSSEEEDYLSESDDTSYLDDPDDLDYLEDTNEDYLEDTDEDYLEDTDEDYLGSEDDSDFGDDSGEIARNTTKPKKPHKTKGENTKQSKRKKTLKKKKQWMKGQKRERMAKKGKRKQLSMDGMRMTRRRPQTNRRRGRSRERDLSRYTRLGLRRKLSGRHYGRNAGKKVYYKNTKKLYGGPRKKVPLRGKAKINAKINKAARG